MTPMIRHHVMQYNVRWLRLVRSCIMSCSWSDAAAALIILFSREREKQGEGGGVDAERVKQRIHWGWAGTGTSRGPPCAPAQNKRKEPTWGGGRSSVWVGRGKRGRVWSPERGKKKVWVREGELTGQGDIKADESADCLPESSLLPDFKRTLMTEDEWWRKKRANSVFVSVCWRWRYGNLKSMKTEIRSDSLCTCS